MSDCSCGKKIMTVRKADTTDVYQDVVRIHKKFRIDKNGAAIPSGTICRIRSPEGQIYAIVRGQGEEGDAESPSIWMDERQRERLGIDGALESTKICLTITVCGVIGKYMLLLNATDPGYRILSLISIASILLSITSMFVQFPQIRLMSIVEKCACLFN